MGAQGSEGKFHDAGGVEKKTALLCKIQESSNAQKLITKRGCRGRVSRMATGGRGVKEKTLQEASAKWAFWGGPLMVWEANADRAVGRGRARFEYNQKKNLN